MKQSLLTMVLGMSVALAGYSPAAAQDSTEPLFKITTASEFAQCTTAVYDYDRSCAWEWNNYAGGYMRLWYYNTSGYGPYVKDYVTTPEIEFEAGVLYSVQLTPLSYESGTTKAASIDLLLGQGDDPRTFQVLAAYTGLPYIGIPNDSHVKTCEFVVPSSGSYRLSLLGKEKFAKVYNFQVFRLGQSARPEAPADFVVTPDASGAASATVTFTLPSSTITGQSIAGDISYSIKRDGTEVESGNGAPGSTVSWTDSEAPEGTVTYSVTVAQGEEVSQSVEQSTFVGLETPAAPGNPAFTSDGDTRTVTWQAPAGIHGIPIDASSLVYTVSRVVDGVEQQLGSVTGVTTYTDSYAPSRPVRLQYTVTAKNGSKESAAALTAAVKAGHIDLPFADSFAGGSFGGVWDVEQVSTSSTYAWKPFSSFYVGRYGSSADILSVDDDGGLAGFESYDANISNQSRLVTAPISRSSSIAPVVEFWFHHDNGSSKPNEGIKLQVSNDNGEWMDVADSHILRYQTDEDKLGWQKFIILLGDALAAECSTYRVGFLTVNEYGNNMALDAVRIFNAVEDDLQVALNGPVRMVAGQETSLEITVANNGSTPVASDSYALELESDLGISFDMPDMVDLQPLSSVKYSLAFTPGADLMLAAESYSFTAKVIYDGDAAPDNNVSSPLVITTAFAPHAPVENLVIADGDDGKALSWDAAGEPGYSPLRISEDFEEAEEGATDNINGFTILDLDEAAGNTWYLCSGSRLNVFHPNSTLEVKGQNALGVTIASYTRQNDWLISPPLSGADISTFDFSMKIGFKEGSSSHDFEVLYATGDYDPENPAEAFTNLIKKETTSSYGADPVKANNKLNTRKYSDIPVEAKYIAVHLNSYVSYASAMWIDDLLIEENNPAPLSGYNVYQKGVGRLNSDLLSSEELSFLLESLQAPADGAPLEFFVTAVYPDGEAQPSNIVSLDLPAAPAGLQAEYTHDVFSGRNDVTLSWEENADAPYADDVVFEVSYNGVKLASTQQKMFVVEYAGYGMHEFEVRAVSGGLTSLPAAVSLEIKAEDYARLSVAVTSDNGWLPEEYSVTIADIDNDGAEPYELVHDNNAVEIGFLPKGNYSVSVRIDGFHDWSEDIALDADVAADVCMAELTTVPFGLSVTHKDGDNGHEYLFRWNEQDPMANYVDTWRVVDYTVSLDGEEYAANVAGTSLVFTGVPEGEHIAGVRANYASGPTDESFVTFLGLSGVGSAMVLADVAGVTGAIRIGVAGEAAVTVHNASGVAVAAMSLSDETVLVPATAGIYLVSVNGRTVKVAVK